MPYWRIPSGGFDILFQGECIAWASTLPEARHYRPDCIAVGPDGTKWMAKGGNRRDGADTAQGTGPQILRTEDSIFPERGQED
jgi:hypothetical protein